MDYNKDLQNTAALFVNGTAELGLFITQERIGLPENLWNQESWMCENQPLVEPSKSLLPSMHLKLGLMKNFVKATNQEEAAFAYLWEKFPRLSEAKLKESIFIGPQIRELIKDEYFDKLLQGDEKAAWDSFKFVVKVFSGNSRGIALLFLGPLH